MKTKNNIIIDVELDNDKIPTKITWSGSSVEKPKSCKAMLLSLLNEGDLDTYKIDLWTKELLVSDMDRFMFQSLKAMAETYFRATKNVQLANDFRKFVDYFGIQCNIISEEKGTH